MLKTEIELVNALTSLPGSLKGVTCYDQCFPDNASASDWCDTTPVSRYLLVWKHASVLNMQAHNRV